MNVADIRNSEWNQHHFWYLCGSIGIVAAALCFFVAILCYLYDVVMMRKVEIERRQPLVIGPANSRLDGTDV